MTIEINVWIAAWVWLSGYALLMVFLADLFSHKPPGRIWRVLFHAAGFVAWPAIGLVMTALVWMDALGRPGMDDEWSMDSEALGMLGERMKDEDDD